MKVIVFGGGISGLTAAHELIAAGFQVELYEKEDDLGGMARSRIEKNGVPSEHSWRGYAPFYKNVFELIKRIPTNNNRSVYSNLSEPINFYLLRDEQSDNNQFSMSIIDYIITFYYSIKFLASNKRRERYYQLKIVPIMKKLLTEDGYDGLIEFMAGPGYGMDKRDVSYGHLFKFLTLSSLNQTAYTHIHGESVHNASGNWHEMVMPTSEAWFNRWKRELQRKGVIIHTNAELNELVIENGAVVGSKVTVNGAQKIIRGDEYIIALNPFNAEQVFKRSQLHQLYKQHRLLNKNSLNNQISFRIGLNIDIKFPVRHIGFVMTDSEFNITFYPQEKYWNNTDIGEKYGIKSLWSGTCIITHQKGRLYNKPAIALNKKELLNEIIYQIIRSHDLQSMVKKHNKHGIRRESIIYTEVWHEWEFINNRQVQKSKKWVNNIYNQQYRPTNRTRLDNMYITGAHTQTSIDVWSMESAVESGKVAANILCEKYDKGTVSIFRHTDPKIFTPLKWVDDQLYKLGMPHLFVTVTILLFYWSYWSFIRGRNT